MMAAQAILVAAALAIALALKPWRQKGIADLLTPLLALLVVLPWLWALPALHVTVFKLQWSGACLAVLMLGWPLAIPVLCAVGAIAGFFADMDVAAQLDLVTWLGVVPATLALAIGAAIRRWLGTRPFVYTLGRGFFASLLALFIAGVLRQLSGHELAGVDHALALVGRWLMAWGDAIVTGMLVAILVAYRPQWLATWSDALYLGRR
jgi:uncharacterized membrane protein